MENKSTLGDDTSISECWYKTSVLSSPTPGELRATAFEQTVVPIGHLSIAMASKPKEETNM